MRAQGDNSLYKANKNEAARDSQRHVLLMIITEKGKLRLSAVSRRQKNPQRRRVLERRYLVFSVAKNLGGLTWKVRKLITARRRWQQTGHVGCLEW